MHNTFENILIIIITLIWINLFIVNQNLFINHNKPKNKKSKYKSQYLV
jgi:hypothetical protein